MMECPVVCACPDVTTWPDAVMGVAMIGFLAFLCWGLYKMGD